MPWETRSTYLYNCLAALTNSDLKANTVSANQYLRALREMGHKDAEGEGVMDRVRFMF